MFSTLSNGWRKGWDSNPRWAFTHGGFQDRCLKPLGHPSSGLLPIARRAKLMVLNYPNSPTGALADVSFYREVIDFARSRQYLKRGGAAQKVSLDEGLLVSKEQGQDLVALDDALKALAAIDGRKGQVVELRFFGGLSVAETAEVLKVSPDTVLRDWRLAKVWLTREMRKSGRHDA